MRRLALLSLLLLSQGALGCGAVSFGAEVRAVETLATTPNDVTVHLVVEESGEPIRYLSTDNFQVYENDILLSSEEIGLRLVSRDEYTSAHTLLLLDLSGSPSPEVLKGIERGAAQFVEKVSTTQPVTVLAFDGGKRPREVARFARVDMSTKRPLPPLEKFLTQDTSRDLNGAILAAISGLGATLKKDTRPMHFGSIVTLVRGPDLAGRHPTSELADAISQSGYEFFSLSPTDGKIPTLDQIGKDTQIEYPSEDTLPMRFQDLGMRVRSSVESHYLLSYCSPGRAGTRKLRIRVEFDSESGSRRITSAKTEFDATEFSGGCTPKGATTASVVPVRAETEESTEAPAALAEPNPAQQGQSSPQSRKASPKKAPPASTEQEESTLNEEEAPVVAPPSTGKYE